MRHVTLPLVLVVAFSACTSDQSGLAMNQDSGGAGGAQGNAGMGGGTDPGSGGANPGSGGANPGSGGANPGSGGTNPGSGGRAGSGGANPGSGGSAGGSGGTASGGALGAGGAAVPTCPGTAPGCVIDFAGQFGTAADGQSVDGIGAAARLPSLASITGSGAYLYITAQHTVRRIEIATAKVETIAGLATQGSFADLVGAAARFDTPDGITTDGNKVWIADSQNFVVRALDLQSRAVTTLAGEVGNPGLQDGRGNNARFEGLRGITFDGMRFLYVTDTTHHAIRRIDTMTADVVTVAGDNGAGTQNGPGNNAQFSSPRKLHAFRSGNLFVADTENNRVRLITFNNGATVFTAAGSAPGFQDAVGVAAMFRRLRGITNDGAALIVADSDNFVLRKIALPGSAVTTIAGTAGVAGHRDGIGTAAQFDKPMDVYFHPGTGDLFIVENTVVRRMYYQ